jgi:hypothetical protein
MLAVAITNIAMIEVISTPNQLDKAIVTNTGMTLRARLQSQARGQ